MPHRPVGDLPAESRDSQLLVWAMGFAPGLNLLHWHMFLGGTHRLSSAAATHMYLEHTSLYPRHDDDTAMDTPFSRNSLPQRVGGDQCRESTHPDISCCPQHAHGHMDTTKLSEVAIPKALSSPPSSLLCAWKVPGPMLISGPSRQPVLKTPRCSPAP